MQLTGFYEKIKSKIYWYFREKHLKMSLTVFGYTSLNFIGTGGKEYIIMTFSHLEILEDL